ncbi:hypothetical protein [Ruegeria arenilitoris]|uniref:hypothetical protein n=1 Tax=Ruegeria arenilitoris TaxID=1173585 RepID=UPI001C2BC74E|nr:hypothetical protein [Ruegeria arenilitoris]
MHSSLRFLRNPRPRSQERSGLLFRGLLLILLYTPANLALAEDNVGQKTFPPQLPDGQQRAFPTAEGHGAAAKGGRGGRAIYVTNTDEFGPGSLRDCIQDRGPRTCIFRVSGTIVLERQSLVAVNPYLTIAGETAPGGGIVIRNGPLQLRPSLEIHTHDVIVRHVRIRPGPHEVKSCCSGAIGVYTRASRDIIFDHISASWGSDETMDSEFAERLTVQWSIFSEPLLSGGPGKSNRARNMLLTKGGNFSVHHNLFSHSIFRNPQISPQEPGTTIEIVNNLMYSPRWQYVVALDNHWVEVAANIIGNLKLTGKNIASDQLVHLFDGGEHGYRLFLKDNIDEDNRADSSLPEELVLAPEHREYVVDTPVVTPLVEADPASSVYETVLQNAGATRPERDSVDERVLDEVRARSGRILKRNPEKVGGWPELISTVPYDDLDQDGVADDWERDKGLNPEDQSDGALDRDGDGWTNLEEFLHELAGDGVGM